MILLDSRRLFGPNLQLPGPGAIAEVAFVDEDAAAAIAGWERAVRQILPAARTAVRRWADGAALVIAGEADEILQLTFLNEWAVAGGAPEELEAQRAALAAARDPALRALQVEARRRGLTVLVDDEQVSIGLGRGARLWPRGELPAPGAVPWGELGAIPVGLVTGTNGKTTSSRLAGRMAQRAGLAVGVALTDAITVGGALVASGDYTGPEAARMVLRHPEVELAVLETARGGILRRGLAVDRCDAALVTNVSDDHLGLYGVDDVATMVQVKGVVARAARRSVLNAGDAGLAAWAAASLDAPIVWFGPGGEWTAKDGWIARGDRPLIEIAAVPIALGGAAAYNVENALGAAALAAELGVPEPAIVDALGTFTTDADDNPGRGNWHDVRGVRVLLDFGHNPEGARAVLAMVTALRRPGDRLHVVVAQPGDRRDDAIAAVARAIGAARADRVVLHDLSGYLRGRSPGQVPALLRAELERAAVPAIEEAESEAAALAQALAGARPGDVVVLMPLLDPEGVKRVLERRS